MQRSKQKRTMADIRTIATAVESYEAENGTYPPALDVLEPRFLKDVPEKDGWGHGWDYECFADDSGKCTRYAIRSSAKDGADEIAELAEAVAEQRGATTNFDCDIIFSNGSFVEYPEGVQR